MLRRNVDLLKAAGITRARRDKRSEDKCGQQAGTPADGDRHRHMQW
jgi:hypothetical protein